MKQTLSSRLAKLIADNHSELKHQHAQRNKFKLTVKSTVTDKIIREFDLDFSDLSEDEIKEFTMNEYKKLLPDENLSISNEAAVREDLSNGKKYTVKEYIDSVFNNDFVDIITRTCNNEVFKDEDKDGMSVFVLSKNKRVDVISLNVNGLQTRENETINWEDIHKLDFDFIYGIMYEVCCEFCEIHDELTK